MDDDPCIHMEMLTLLFTRGPVPAGRFEIPLGVADVKRAGDDVTVVTWGWQVAEALAAAETLEAEGISVEVLDLRTLVPLDARPILASAARTRRVVVVHAAPRFGGPGGRDRLAGRPRALRGAGSPGRAVGFGLLPDPVRLRAGVAALPRAGHDRRHHPTDELTPS